MTETCKEVRDAIALEGKAPGDKKIREHLSACPECARFLTSVLAVERELGDLETEDVSDVVVDALMARSELSRGSRRGLHWAMGLAAAAAIAFVAARVTLVGQKSFSRESEVAALESPRVQVDNRALENDELSSEDRQRLDALGYSQSRERPADEPAVQDERGRYELPASEEPLAPQEELNERAKRNARFVDDDGASRDAFETKESGARGRIAASEPPPEPEPETFAGEGSVVGGLPSSAMDNKAQAGAKQKNEAGASETLEILSSAADPLAGELIIEAQDVNSPKKRVHVDPIVTGLRTQARVSGAVILRVTIDREGNVTDADVVQSLPAFDQAAKDAVMQWKYEPSEEAQRMFLVRVDFAPPEEPNDDARLFLEERERIENLRFRDPRGYWANTYVPGDPNVRFLAMRLNKAEQHVAPHAAVRPVAQPFDAPQRAALALTLHADRRGITEPSRMLVQVGLQATEDHGRRRPPMNVGIVVDGNVRNVAALRSLVTSLERAKTTGDRFRLILPGRGEVVAPHAVKHGPPPGPSLVLVATTRTLDGELDAIARLAHRSAVGGVPVSVIGVGESVDASELERLALSGQGRRYLLEAPQDASGIVDRELAASSRVVARAVRLKIKLAEGVKLVDVIGSEPLSERQAERVREAEKAIDLRLSRNLGIEADRGEDEDGIQIVIPSFYAGDAHTILLDVVATRPGPIAEVTARYKDLAELRNTVAKASLALPRSSTAHGPLETNVLKNYLAFRLSESLEAAGDTLERGNRGSAIAELTRTKNLLRSLALASDREIARDVAMLTEYIELLASSTEPALLRYLADSLRYAGAIKERLPRALT